MTCGILIFLLYFIKIIGMYLKLYPLMKCVWRPILLFSERSMSYISPINHCDKILSLLISKFDINKIKNKRSSNFNYICTLILKNFLPSKILVIFIFVFLLFSIIKIVVTLSVHIWFVITFILQFIGIMAQIWANVSYQYLSIKDTIYPIHIG